MNKIKLNWPKIILNVLGFIPMALILIAWLRGGLGVNPIQRSQQLLGDTALILLLMTLAITPIKNVTGYNKLGKYKRTLGLLSFYYALVHVFIYAVIDYQLNFKYLWASFLHLWYLWASVPAFLILTVLAVTSLKSLKVKLGKKWKPIHRFVYLAGVLVVIHYLLVMKGGTGIVNGGTVKPLIAGGILLVLLIARLPFKRWFKKAPQPV
jgi:methionine sulfoxide reductase heme-binding subunit